MHPRILFLLPALILVTGCDDEITLAKACDGLDGFCEVIKPDSNCRRDREAVITTAFEIEQVNQNPSSQAILPQLKYRQLNNLERFEHCSYLQTLIEYKPADVRFAGAERLPTGEFSKEVKEKMAAYTQDKIEKKRDKLRTYRETKRYLDILSENTADSNDPHLLYWHWSRNHDESAMAKITHQYRMGKIDEYDMLFYIGQYMSRFDKQESKELFLASLEGYPEELYTSKKSTVSKKLELNPTGDDNGRIHYEVLRSLVKIYFDEEKYDASYVFARVLKINNDRSADIDMIIDYMHKHNRSKLPYHDDLADNVHQALGDGEFAVRNFQFLG